MSKVYLDANVWSRPFDRPSPRVIDETDAFFKILEKAVEGRLTIVDSVALDVEIGNIENPEKKAATEELIGLFASEKIYDISASK